MSKILSILKNLLKHELITGSFFVFIGGLVASFIAFIFNLLMARVLTYADYGVYLSLVSIITLATIPAQSLTTTIVRFATVYFTQKDLGKAAVFYKKASTFWLIVGVLIFLLFSIFSPVISSFLHIQNNFLVITTALSIAFVYIGLVNVSFLQSLLKFKFLSFVYISSALVKVFFGGLVIYLMLGVQGALWAIFLMVLSGYVISFISLRFLFSLKEKAVDIDWKGVISYAIPTGVTVLFLTSLITTDVILVKHLFPAEEAGLYGGISLIGKVTFFFTAPIPSVMFPLLVRRHAKNEDFRSILYLALILVAIPSFVITAFYFLLPGPIVKLFLGGGEYMRIVPYIGLFGVLVTIYSILNVIVSFFLSLKKTSIAFFVVFASLMQISLIFIFNDSFYQVIFVSIFSSLLLLGLLLIYYLRSFRFKL